MKVWLTCFLLLFGMAELYQWLKHFSLPLPLYILGGAFLAIASNYNRRAGFPFQQFNEKLTLVNTPSQVMPNSASVELPSRPQSDRSLSAQSISEDTGLG